MFAPTQEIIFRNCVNIDLDWLSWFFFSLSLSPLLLPQVPGCPSCISDACCAFKDLFPPFSFGWGRTVGLFGESCFWLGRILWQEPDEFFLSFLVDSTVVEKGSRRLRDWGIIVMCASRTWNSTAPRQPVGCPDRSVFLLVLFSLLGLHRTR